jgi:adhesin transport system outer membrane protein
MMVYRSRSGMILVAALLASAAAAQPGPAALPPPSGEPQKIVPAADPLLRRLALVEATPAFADVVAQAVIRHPQVAEAIEVQREARNVRAEVRAQRLPAVDLTLQGDRAIARDFNDENGENIIERSRPRSRVDAVASATQLITDFGATTNRVKAASARIRVAEAEVKGAAGNVAINAVAAHHELLARQTLVDIARANVDRHRGILEDVRTRFRQGVGPAGDVARVEAYLASAEGRLLLFERQLASARARYLEAFGTPAPERVGRPQPPATAASSVEAAQALARANPTVAARQAAEEAAERDWKAARADRLPRIQGGVDASQYDIVERDRDYDVRARVTLRQSLFGGGRSEARAEQARARFRQAEFATERVAEEAARDATIAFNDVASLERQTETLRTAYIANRRTRDLFVEQFRVARGSLIDVLRAEQDYFEAAALLIEGASELDVARYALLERTGEILDRLGVAIRFDGDAGAGR